MKTIIRNFLSLFRRFRVAMVLNILGLSVAFTVFMLIAMQVKYDYTFNHTISGSDDIYRVEYRIGDSWVTPFNRPYADLIFESSPLIKDGTYGLAFFSEVILELEKNGTKERFKAPHCQVLPNYPGFFSFEMVEGNINTLDDPEKVIIPESLARTMFGESSPVGEILYTEGARMIPPATYTVGGVYKDFPSNSSLKNGMYVSMGDENKDVWGDWSYECYIRIDEAGDASHALDAYYEKYHEEFAQKLFGTRTAEFGVRMTPFKDLHYIKNVLYDSVEKSSHQTLLVLSAIAFVLLCIAVINYTNFSMALAPVRIKSINTQKVMGAGNNMLRRSLVFETLLLCLFAFSLSLFAVHLVSLSWIQGLLNVTISISKEIPIVLLTGVIAIIIAVVAGLYPAIYITSFSPALVLKGSFGLSPKGRQLRNILIGFQYIASFVLIIGAAFMFLQNQFMQNSSLGYQKDQVIVSTLNKTVLSNKEALRNELLSYAGIDKIAFAEDLLSGSEIYSMYGQDFRNGEEILYYCLSVDPGFLDVMGIEVQEGRSFREGDKAGEKSVLIFNERALAEYNLELGEKIQGSEIIGFMNNVKFTSVRQEMSPMAFEVKNMEEFNPNYLYVKTHPGINLNEAITYVNSTLQKMDSGYPFDVWFYDQVIQQIYNQENKMSVLITLFSLIAVLISIVGVFGLVIFESEYKVKEIGIRKVLGSTTKAILLQYNKSYLYIVLVCFALAVPIGYILVSNWLENFVDRIPLSPFVFILAFLVISLITIMTVTFQNWRVANMNPVESLKNE